MSFVTINPVTKRFADKYFSEWLYGEYDERKLKQFEAAYSVPGVRNYMDYLLDRRADQEYMARNQLTYNDVHDPRKLRETSSGSRMYGSFYHFVSKNVEKLYE